MQNIVVGFDGSPSARRALERAAAFGRSGATVTVVTAVAIGLRETTVLGALDEVELREAKEALEAARSELETQGIDVHAIEGEGEPADVIVEVAKERNADLVVVGTRGLGAAKRLVLGSVSTRVVHDAPCDVLVVR